MLLTCFSMLSISLFNMETVFSNSSISRRRLKRLLEFLNAPPVMEPPGLISSPSRVTRRRDWRYFLAILIPSSIVLTTIVLPSSWSARPSKRRSTCTNVFARPITPLSFKASGLRIPPLPCILVRGRNVARPNLFVFRNAIIRFAVSSLSVTIFWILPPSAVSIAISYSLSTLMISATTPIRPFSLSLLAITFRILFPYPSYRSVIFLSDSSREDSL